MTLQIFGKLGLMIWREIKSLKQISGLEMSGHMNAEVYMRCVPCDMNSLRRPKTLILLLFAETRLHVFVLSTVFSVDSVKMELGKMVTQAPVSGTARRLETSFLPLRQEMWTLRSGAACLLSDIFAYCATVTWLILVSSSSSLELSVAWSLVSVSLVSEVGWRTERALRTWSFCLKPSVRLDRKSVV